MRLITSSLPISISSVMSRPAADGSSILPRSPLNFSRMGRMADPDVTLRSTTTSAPAGAATQRTRKSGRRRRLSMRVWEYDPDFRRMSKRTGEFGVHEFDEWEEAWPRALRKGGWDFCQRMKRIGANEETRGARFPP